MEILLYTYNTEHKNNESLPYYCILIVDVESQKLQQSLSPPPTTLPPAPATAPPFIEYALVVSAIYNYNISVV